MKVLKAANSPGVRPAMGPPAPGGPFRTPGSFCAYRFGTIAIPARANAHVAAPNHLSNLTPLTDKLFFFVKLSPLGCCFRHTTGGKALYRRESFSAGGRRESVKALRNCFGQD